MGMFATVCFDCPKCHSKIGIQSKADRWPPMEMYSLSEVPTHILNDILNRPHKCRCGEWIVLYDPNFPPIPKRANPAALVVRSPKNEHVIPAYNEFWPDDEEFEIVSTQKAKP